jgi:hypothetical protein
VKPVTTSLVLVAALSAAAPSLYAAEGILLVEKNTSGGTTTTNQIQIEKNRMRAEVSNATGGNQTMIFDGVKQVLWIVNNEKKTYSEITKEDVDRLSSQMSGAMQQMQAQLANLPPEQRARVEAMMKGRGGMPGGAPAPKTEYKKVGTDKVNAWTCDKYEGTLNGQKNSELCTVEPQALGFTAGDFAVAGELQAFFAKLVPQGSENMFRIGSVQDQGFSGVPVRRVSFGTRPSTAEITSVTHQNFSDAVFTVPDGYQKEASPFAGRGRGRQ